MQECPPLSRNQRHALHRLIVALFSIAFIISHSPSLTAPFDPLLAVLQRWKALNSMLLLTSLLFLLLLLLNMGWNDGNDSAQDHHHRLRLTENGSTKNSIATSSEENMNPAEAWKNETHSIQSEKGVIADQENSSTLSQSRRDVRLKQGHRRYYCIDDNFERGSTRLNNDLYYFDSRSNRRHRRASSLDWNCQGKPRSIQAPPTHRTMQISSNNGSTSTAVYSDPYLAQQEATSMPNPSPGSDSSVNKKAEAFITHFREQMRLEQAQSFERRNNIKR